MIFLQHFAGSRQPQQGRSLAFAVTVEILLFNGGEQVFDLVGRVAEGVEDSDDAAETGASDALNVEAFLLETTDDANVRVAFGASAAECKGDVHFEFQVSVDSVKFQVVSGK